MLPIDRVGIDFAYQIAVFRESHPGIGLSITVASSSDLEQRLAEFRDDVAIIVGPAARLDTRPLLEEPPHLYGAGTDPAAGTWALYPAGSRTRDAIDIGLAAAGIRPNVAVESANPAVLRELAALTGSFTVLPAAIGEAGTALPRLLAAVATREFVVAGRELVAPPPLVADFVAELGGC